LAADLLKGSFSAMADIETTAVSVLADETTSAALPPHMRKAANLTANWAARAAGTGFATAALLPWRIDPQSWPQIWQELWEMQEAVWQRQRQMQDNWLQGWLNWTTECTQARGANTITRLAEQEFDLIAQWQELVAGQATDVVSLLENLELNYGYWLAEKLR
jgi:hypothetical protein